MFTVSIKVDEDPAAAREEVVTLQDVSQKLSDLKRSTLEIIKGRIVEIYSLEYLVEIHLRFGTVNYKITKHENHIETE